MNRAVMMSRLMRMSSVSAVHGHGVRALRARAPPSFTVLWSLRRAMHGRSQMLGTNTSPLTTPPSPQSQSQSTTTTTATTTTTTTTIDDHGDYVGDKGVSNWLFGVAGLVFGMVALGGLTRLTKSGLSMVEWKPAQGLPPLSESEWQSEFDKYQQYPEYRLTNSDMTLNEFKFIYLMEFTHRELGRFIGVAFAIPFAYFAYRRRLSGSLIQRLGLLLCAGGVQGGIGWWMVKSGLDAPHRPDHSANIHVSPYRLATHLLSAFVIYAGLLHTALLTRHPITPAQVALFQSSPGLRRLKSLSLATAAIIGLTIASGAFVAGNEAGLVYSEWPLMGGRFVPEDLVSPFIHPTWRNLFEHSSLVQFDHRMLAYTTFFACLGLFVYSRRMGPLPVRVKAMSHAVVAMATAQASLGVLTLVNQVPVPLASLHQCGSLALLTFIIALVHACGGPRAKSLTAPLVRQLKSATQASSTAQTVSKLMKSNAVTGS